MSENWRLFFQVLCISLYCLTIHSIELCKPRQYRVSQFQTFAQKFKNFWWVAFSRFESKINFWQINSILENMVLRTPVLIQQSINFWIFQGEKSGISFRQHFLFENVSKIICSTTGHTLFPTFGQILHFKSRWPYFHNFDQLPWWRVWNQSFIFMWPYII